jgi:transcription elongation factor GreA
MTDKTVYLTKEGLEKLKVELDDLVTNQRPVIIKEIRETRALGDLSENGGYQAAREKQTFIDSRIQEIENTLKFAKVKSDTEASKKIDIGSKVHVEVEGDKNTFQFEIVGATEADPAVQKISYESPIGKSLYGSKVGDTVKVQTPVGETKYKITKVE